MNKRRIWRLLALLFAFSLVAAACGDSDSDSESTEAGDETETTAADSGDDMSEEEDDSSIGGGVTQEELDDAANATTTTESEVIEAIDESTLDGIFEAADLRRAETVAELTAGIEAGDYGVGDDGVLRGPAGFEVSISDCPADWSDTTGITDTEIRIGHTTAQSGNLAAYGNIALGWDNYNQWVNENGGVGGLDITLITKDLSLIHI